jgi:DNA end-binding protein Ku
MRKKHYVGALLAEDGHILLVTLRHAKEVVLASDLEAPSGRDLSESEVRMARQLVSALEGTFDPSEYRDEYRERVMDLIRTKARGGKVKIRKYKPPPARKSLEKALQESLRRVGRERRTA